MRRKFLRRPGNSRGRSILKLKIDILLYNGGYLASTVIMMPLYKSGSCRAWYTLFNVYYILNSCQLYRLLYQKASVVVKAVTKKKRYTRTVYWAIHGVHFPTSMVLSLVSALSPYEDVLIRGENFCLSKSPLWMWLTMLSMSAFISMLCWGLFILPLLFHNSESRTKRRGAVETRNSVASERKMWKLIRRKIMCASIAILSTFVFLLYTSLISKEHGILVCEVTTSFGTLDLLLNFIAINASWPATYYIDHLRCGELRSRAASRAGSHHGRRDERRSNRAVVRQSRDPKPAALRLESGLVSQPKSMFRLKSNCSHNNSSFLQPETGLIAAPERRETAGASMIDGKSSSPVLTNKSQSPSLPPVNEKKINSLSKVVHIAL